MLRKVIDIEYTGACRYTGYIPKSIRFTLDCGHQLHRKASQGIPQRAKCRECDLATTSPEADRETGR